MRVNAVFAGLGVGLVLAAVLGALPNLEAAEGAAIFVVDPLRCGLPRKVGQSSGPTPGWQNGATVRNR